MSERYPALLRGIDVGGKNLIGYQQVTILNHNTVRKLAALLDE